LQKRTKELHLGGWSAGSDNMSQKNLNLSPFFGPPQKNQIQNFPIFKIESKSLSTSVEGLNSSIAQYFGNCAKTLSQALLKVSRRIKALYSVHFHLPRCAVDKTWGLVDSSWRRLPRVPLPEARAPSLVTRAAIDARLFWSTSRISRKYKLLRHFYSNICHIDLCILDAGTHNIFG